MDGRRKVKRKLSALILAVVILCGALLGGCAKDIAISGVSPENYEQVVIINDDMYDFFTNYEYGYSKKYAKEVDNFAPLEVVLSWNTPENPLKCEVFVSTDKNLKDAEVYETCDNDVALKNLFANTEYFWQVKVYYDNKTENSKIYNFKTADTCRTVSIDHVVNTRDLGGQRTIYGKRIKQGMIYRGANVDGISEQGKYTFTKELGIRFDLDLRPDGEGLAGRGVSPSGCERYKNFDAPLYLGIRDKYEALRDEIKVFTDESNYPVYFHCQIGRDRTGTLGFFLGCILGVPEQFLYREYETSSFNSLGGNDPMGLLDGNLKPMVNYLDDYEGRTVNERAANYLKTIGVTDDDMNKIRSIMLE